MLGWVLPLMLGVIAFGYAVLNQESFSDVIFYGTFVFAATFVLVRRLLRWKARQRCEVIRKEVIPFYIYYACCLMRVCRWNTFYW